MKQNKTLRGFSLLEITLTILILVSAIGLVAAGISFSSGQQKKDELRQGLVLLKRNIQDMYQGPAAYGALTTKNAIALKLADPSLLKNFSHSFVNYETGGLVVSGVSGDKKKFSLTVKKLPVDVCVAVADIFDADPDFVSVAVNASGALGGKSALKAADSCANGNDNTVTYILQ